MKTDLVRRLKMRRILLIATFILLLSIEAFCYEVNVHEQISEKAIAASNLEAYLRSNLMMRLNDSFANRNVIKWIKTGSNWEDNDPFGGNARMRWLNHFYDPTTGKGLNSGGLIIYGKPSLQWGMDALTNTWSWKWARDYLYKGITLTDKAAKNDSMAKTFRALGQVIHLIQDKAVPAHVRNDAHNFSKKQLDMYEMFTKKDDGYPVADNLTFNTFDAFWKISTAENTDGQMKEITYFIYFVKDGDGIWKIESL
jgi:hypothetical protein